MMVGRRNSDAPVANSLSIDRVRHRQGSRVPNQLRQQVSPLGRDVQDDENCGGQICRQTPD
jgi:hypothetical protein